MHYHSPPFSGSGLPFDVFLGSHCKPLIGEVAERSKALDWNSSNILTGVRGFESHPLRHRGPLVVRASSFATTRREPRQARKGATVTVRAGAEVRLVRTASTSRARA